MPNWCNNTLVIYGSDYELSKFEYQTIERKGSNILFTMEKLYPSPKDDNNWRIANWGTKWDIGEVNDYHREEGKGKIVIDFDSAWSPPCEWVKYVGKNYYPDLDFTLYYIEEGVGFAGKLEVNGEDVLELQGDILYTDEQGREVYYDTEAKRYKYPNHPYLIMDDNDFMPSAKNPYQEK